ncbi:putative SOS response-associated peptidase YedK [Actinocorallia herbida]|uniref:Abasic site processing protein n=1 Tax=Actinocorallia herbida TaxID=58109 RepID=A0A3N1CPE7_9ACTN|nr:SOS response-associated peptidase [Actinocorallia herbida]ROO83181.1 putative SOS response-associated peptidase YedK [Actinocorallia herbida]
MCGRYATARARQELLDEFRIEVDETVADDGRDLLQPDYNAAPTKDVPAVLVRPPHGHGHGGQGPGAQDTPEEALRTLRMVRWGLVPSWAKDPGIGNRMINARVETLAEKPAYRRAFARRRCLLPADGYYEWYKGEDGKKQPFFIRPDDGGVLPMAGLYELWKSPEGEWLFTCTVITAQAADELGHIHDRMPMTVTDPDAWLDPARTDTAAAGRLLVPAMSRRLEAYPVGKEVGNVRSSGPQLIRPIAEPGVPAGDASDDPDPAEGDTLF